MYLFPLLLIVPTLLANPIPQTDSKNLILHIYTCTEESFKGQCNNLHLQASQCQKLGDDLADKISSAGPDNGTFCTLYTNGDCTGRALPFTYPGIRKLAKYRFDDVTESIRCDFINN